MQSFYELTPDVVLNALESQSFRTTGKVMQLNSYENRVFEIELEPETVNEKSSVIAKFYRPARWSRSALIAEHDFLDEIALAQIPTAPALKLPNGSTVSETHGIFWSVFPKIRGRMPQEMRAEDLTRVGRALALLHNVGVTRSAPARPTLNSNYFEDALVLLEKWIGPEVRDRYLKAGEELLDAYESRLRGIQFQRIHGDCHRGNLLQTSDERFFFVDFDDFCNGPTAQDFWMLVAGTPEEKSENLEALMAGYEEIRVVDDREFDLLAPLQGLRLLHYSAWIARRWEDPSFPRLFPDFGSFNYWSEEVEALEKIAWGL